MDLLRCCWDLFQESCPAALTLPKKHYCASMEPADSLQEPCLGQTAFIFPRACQAFKNSLLDFTMFPQQQLGLYQKSIPAQAWSRPIRTGDGSGAGPVRKAGRKSGTVSGDPCSWPANRIRSPKVSRLQLLTSNSLAGRMGAAKEKEILLTVTMTRTDLLAREF